MDEGFFEAKPQVFSRMKCGMKPVLLAVAKRG